MLNPLEAINEEISLAGKYAQEDAAQAVAEARFIREENGYYEQSIQEKLDNGLLEDFPDDQTPGSQSQRVSRLISCRLMWRSPSRGMAWASCSSATTWIVRLTSSAARARSQKGKTGSSPALRSKASTLRPFRLARRESQEGNQRPSAGHDRQPPGSPVVHGDCRSRGPLW